MFEEGLFVPLSTLAVNIKEFFVPCGQRESLELFSDEKSCDWVQKSPIANENFGVASVSIEFKSSVEHVV